MNTERILFQADANFDMNIVRGLKRQQPSIDFQSADDAGLRGKSDVEVLGIAADQGRILVSHDKRTMLTHFQTFLASGRHSPGVFIIDDATPIGDAIEILLVVWRASEPEEWLDRYERLA